MNWTNKKPTVPGWYWWYIYPHAPEIVSVVHGPTDDPDQMYAHFRTANNKTFDGPLVALGGQFAGPIPEPIPHPVDVLKDYMARSGNPISPDEEERARAICDEEVPVVDDRALLKKYMAAVVDHEGAYPFANDFNGIGVWPDGKRFTAAEIEALSSIAAEVLKCD